MQGNCNLPFIETLRILDETASTVVLWEGVVISRSKFLKRRDVLKVYIEAKISLRYGQCAFRISQLVQKCHHKVPYQVRLCHCDFASTRTL